MPDNTRRLKSFHGGLALEAHKLESSEQGLTALPLPGRLVLPLLQHAGVAAIPTVKAGDRVMGNQEIASADGEFSCSLHAPTSARVAGIQRLPIPHPGGLLADCLVLEPDGLAESAQFLPSLDPAGLDRASLLQRVRETGIAGLGGAVFPTARKLAGVAGDSELTLVINGAECEPYISCDDILMRTQPTEILLGAQILMNTLAINRAIVAIEQDKHQAMNRMRAALTQLGDLRIQLEPIFPVYPAGGERQLIQVLTGKEVPAGGLPIDIGILCQNVATLVAIYQAVVKGSPLISRITTITGSGISRPGNFQVLLGTPISALADAAGGYTQFASRLIMGGPMMGIALTCDDVPVVKATNCILVMEEAELRPTLDNMPCIRCGECEQVCPAQLQPQELYWRIRGGNLVGADELGLTACIECGCCDLVCPSHIPLSQHYRFAKAQVRTARLKREQSDIARQRFENRQLRLEQEATRRKQRLEEKRKARSSGRDDTKEIKGEIDAILARTENRQPGAGEKDETP